MNDHHKIVIIGAGNVATHLARALKDKANVIQIFSRHLENAQLLAKEIGGCKAIDKIGEIDAQADFYIISVKDDAIASVIDSMPQVDGIVMHTAGSVPLDIINARFERRGVMYPLQTFSKDIDIDLRKVPFFIEAPDVATFSAIHELAAKITDAKIIKADSAQRAVLHLAAVFACNFTNHLWGAAYNVLQTLHCDLDVVSPLIHATLDKALANNPAEVQTGPAARADYGIMNKQEQMLDPHWRNIYHLLSQSILNKTLDHPII